jgi:DNA-binding NarL/FixJ family response regulator
MESNGFSLPSTSPLQTRTIKTVQILIVDAQRCSRQALRALLATWPAAGQLSEAENDLAALRLVAESQPNLVVMDVYSLEEYGLQTIRRIKSEWPQVKVVALSMYPDALDRARLAGADLCISKGETPEKFLAALAQFHPD